MSVSRGRGTNNAHPEDEFSDYGNVRAVPLAAPVLAIDGGYSQTEIAERLELPLGTVKAHARRGLIRLRELLTRVDNIAAAGPSRRVESTFVGGVKSLPISYRIAD